VSVLPFGEASQSGALPAARVPMDEIIVTSEPTAGKAARYAAEGRLTVTRLDGDELTATCLGGNGAVYDLGHTPGRGWWCSCPAWSECSHLVALQLVAVRRPVPAAAGSR
jgi:uncharacterized Zn finger protein